MKRIILLLGLCAVLGSCSINGDDYSILYLRSYVQLYMEPEELETQLSYGTTPGEINLSIYVSAPRNPRVVYVAPEFGLSIGTEKYLELAERNGDLSYNRTVDFRGITPSPEFKTFATDFRELRVVCTNADWDESHPKGTPLNDVVRITFSSCYDYVQSGYDPSVDLYKYKLVSELTANDLRMLNSYFYFHFNSCPDQGYFILRITLVTTDGKEISVEEDLRLWAD